MKLTDATLRDLYLGLVNHYGHCRDSLKLNSTDTYHRLYYTLWHSLEDPYGTLSKLEPAEKLKAYHVLNTFFYASPAFQSPNLSAPPVFFQGQAPAPSVVIIDATPRYYCHPDNYFLNLMLWNSWSHPTARWSTRSDEHSHTHGHQSQKKDENKTGATLILIALVAAIAASALIALWYLVRQMVNSAERFYYNEGWVQASYAMLSMAVSGIATGMLAQAFVLSPLLGLAIAAGVSNPVGLAVFGVIGISIVGAALGSLITNAIQSQAIKNSEALNPSDPHRFTLTDAEADLLVRKGIDPLKAKCAMVALYDQMSKLPKQSMCESIFSRRSSAVQTCLDQIRRIRGGSFSGSAIVYVGPMTFDLRIDTFQAQPILAVAAEVPLHLRAVPVSLDASGGYPLPAGDAGRAVPVPVPVVVGVASTLFGAAGADGDGKRHDEDDNPTAVVAGGAASSAKTGFG